MFADIFDQVKNTSCCCFFIVMCSAAMLVVMAGKALKNSQGTPGGTNGIAQSLIIEVLKIILRIMFGGK